MFPKKLLMFVTALIFSFSSFTFANDAQSDKSNENTLKANIQKNWTKEDFKNYYKKTNQRKPKAKDASINKEDQSKAKVEKKEANPKKKEANQKKVSNLPSNMIFPGEYEEVKAVMMTWPYVVSDSNGNTPKANVYVDQIFNNWGEYIEKYPNTNIVKKITYGKCTSVIDLFEESPYPYVFGSLANAIDENAEVWINVWHAEDSTKIIEFMSSAGLPLQHARFFVNPGNSFWYRDCGPVAFYYGNKDSVGFVDFEYYGGRQLDDSIPVFVGKKMGYPVYTSTIEYEGGNILLDGVGNLFTSSALDTTNFDNGGRYIQDVSKKNGFVQEYKKPLTEKQIKDSLTYLLNLKSIHILPMLQYDGGTGHIDLYADVWDENNMVFSKMPAEMDTMVDYSIVSKNVDTIMSFVKSDGNTYRKSYIPFPRRDDGTWYESSEDYNQYTRTYSNHTFVNKAIIQPVFADDTYGDTEHLQSDLDSISAKYPGYKIYPIDVSSFDGSGGAIHCITKQVPAENPIRIISLPIESVVAKNTSYPISAMIYNNSGIEKATCKWRYKGGADWNSVDLTPSASVLNQFLGAIPNDLNDGIIEYYLEAKSNNGKTIAKPITAPAGFYTFIFGSPNGVNEAKVIENRLGDFYPNPSNESAKIRINANNLGFEISIIDMLGKVVYSNNNFIGEGFDAISINTKSFNAGTYIATIKFSDGFVAQKKLTVIK